MTDKATLSKYLRKVTGDLRDANRRIGELEQQAFAPLAIVGISCRYPGGVRGAEGLWDLVAAGADAIAPFPRDRGWPLETLFDPDPEHPGTSYASEGGFLADADEFDAGFFGIGPREALAMDPQQRLLLEAAWETLEDAGIDPAALAGSASGVFAGVMHHGEYGRETDDAELEGHRGIGTASSILAGRVAYTLGLEGPAVTIDTACSSSLVAMHLAAGALRGGECDLALAGGVTVMATPAPFIEFSRQRGMAPDGRCKSFDAAADGTGWSEGVGLLLLERLADAERNGHEVLALLRGSATNQDGASNGLTAPNGPSQERVIRQALANAGLEASEVDAVEAHGTGTALGDPIEAQALLATYGQDRGEAGPLRLGAIKSNLGHTQAAAGVAGVIKMAMAMRHGVLPKTLHLEEPSPHVDWEAGAVELLGEAQPWEAGERPRRAAVSSFGISGTNAHVILEEAPALVESDGEDEKGDAAPAPPAIPLPLSAKGEGALCAQAGRLAEHLRGNPDLDLRDVGFSLAASRATLQHRATAIGADREELLEILGALAAGKPHPGLVQGKATNGKLAFLFSGQGAQRAGMGRELYESFSTFASALDEICAELDPHLGRSLKELLFVEEGSEQAALLDQTEFTQPALFALEVALFRQLESWGLTPDYLLGHSIGELAAAHVAGVFDLPDACKLIAARGALMGALPEGGAMVAIEASEAEIQEELSEGLSIAGINGPDAVVVSGEESAALKLAEAWKDKDRKTSRLRVSHAFHSELMEPMLEEFEAVAETIDFQAPRLVVLSNLTGEPLTPEQATDPAYWAAQVRNAVRFADGVTYLAEQGVAALLELGPDGPLCAMAQGCFAAAEKEAVAVPTLRKDREEAQALLGSLAAVQANGAPFDWAQLFQGAKRVPLPTYAFQRQRYWLEASAASGDASANGQSAADHPLLSAAISLPAEQGWLLTGRLSLKTHPWLSDHRVHGTAILPGTGFVELALKAAEQSGAEAIEELTIESPLVLPETGAVQVQVSVGAADENGTRSLAIHSRIEDAEDPEREWTSNAAGAIGDASGTEPQSLTEWPPAGAEPLAIDSLYERTAELGIDYGPAFQGVKAAWKRGEELFAEVELDADQAAQAERFALHPALLDSSFHPALAATEPGPGEGPSVPFAWGGVRLHRPGAAALRVAMRPDSDDGALVIADASGAPLASVASLSARPIPAAALAGADPHRDSLFELAWNELELTDADPVAAEVCTPIRLQSSAATDLDTAAQALAAEALGALQSALAADAETRHAFITQSAMAVASEETPDPAAAAVWGLIRSAQAEHPGRFLLIDTDGSEASEAALATALAQEEEPQLALRDGAALVPRLARLSTEEAEPAPLDPEKTVLITGATGALGALFARHLVAAHGARQLLLVSRRGSAAPGTAELREELQALGAEVRIEACDAGEREQLAALLDTIPAEHPLGAVFHAAAVFDNALVAAMTPEQLARVLVAKASAAWNLHELTAGAELSAFVLFSSIAGSFENPGQGNYAAANSFLDALAQRRRGEGLAASSLAWGPWGGEGGAVDSLGDADRARLRRAGFLPISPAQGLELYERGRGAAFVLAAPLDLAALRAQGRGGGLAPLYSGLVRVPARRAAPAGSLAARLTAAAADEREGIVRALVAEHAAAVLGHASAAAIDPATAFKDLGFDSLGAVELRNRLGQATGLRLPSTLVFDHPSTIAAAAFLRELAEGQESAPVAARLATRSEEPIAIVGMSCRYPGGIDSPAGLWELLDAGADAVGPFPQDRGWDLERLFDPDPDRPGTSYVREGAFLADPAGFDAAFFGISPREALEMDPQQRLLLEAAWEVLEDAGIDPGSLAGSATGVFAGVMHHDYALAAGPATASSGYEGATSGGSVVSGRVAYALGLEGPAITVDTACSSSLVAVHLAAASLRSGESELALAGGVSVLSTPGMYVMFSRQRNLAPDGRSKSFDAAADGTGWSEGVGALLLERLADAERNGHEVLALVRGSATNQDGASNGLTAPNGPSQERVIRQALANAGLAAADVDAVDAHGTGTTLGDPIEAQALLATYGQDRGEAGPLRLGSVKSNLNHAMAAAGVAGVIKMALALRHGVLPKTLHLEEPTPHVDWSAGAVELLSEAQPWQRGERPRRAGISSFGISGTNAHVILEEAPALPAKQAPEERPPLAATPLLLSAKGEAALREQGQRLADHLRRNPELDLGDVGFSLATGRAALEQRAAALGGDREQLLDALAALAAGRPHSGLIQGRAQGGKLAFLFPGQGSQWPAMAVELLADSPRFAAEIAACTEALEPFIDFALADVLRADPGAPGLDRAEVLQPTLFAMLVSLAKLWRHHGVEPGAVVGHSQGEVAAAHIAGALSLSDAARVAARRAQAGGELIEQGCLVSLALSSEEVRTRIEPWGEALSLAVFNGPAATVVSGELEAQRELLAACEADGVRARAIPVSYASHSPQVEAVRERLLADLAPISPRPSEVPFYSTATAERIPGEELGAEYWYRALREPVLFAQATAAMRGDGFTTFLETSPHPVLTTAIQEGAEAAGEEAVTLGTLHREEGGLAGFAASLAAAHVSGVAVRWPELFPGASRVPLPTYAFQRQRYWLEPSAAAGDVVAAGQGDVEHPLLSAAISLPAEGGWLFTGRLSLKTHAWLGDHRVHGVAILPGTGFAELGLKAAELVGAEAIEELTIEAPLVLPEQGAVQIQVAVGPADERGSRALAIHSRLEDGDDPEREWTINAAGALGAASAAEPEALREWPPAGAEPLAIDSLYERTAALGIDYGPAFQGVKAAWQRGEELFAEVELDPEQAEQAGRFGLHPALLDSSFHPAVAATEPSEGEGPSAPFSWSGVRLHRAGAAALRVAIRPADSGGGLAIADASGEPVLSVDSLATRAIPVAALAAAGADPHRDSLFTVEWVAQPLSASGGEAELVELAPDPGLDPASAAQALAIEALQALQAAIADEEEPRLAFLTTMALAVGDGETPDPAAASVWGLVRSAQAEHPGRFLLIDTDGSEASAAALPAALAEDAAEPQLALREGAALVPRLARLAAAEAEPTPLDPARTVLITGATGSLGALFARHLVAAHGARQLLLVSRRGPDAPGAGELREELQGLGAEVRIEACDVGVREQLAALLDSIPAEQPLGAVFHAAGAIDDGLVESLDRERLETPFAAKAAAAWHLHELTAGAELSDFVLFSSIAGTFASPGQGNYAVANAFLDALAQERRATGLPARTVAWGGWGQETEMTRHVGEAGRARFMRGGVKPIADAEGLELFERARAASAPFLLAAPLDTATLRAAARAGTMAPLFSGLVRMPARRAVAATGALAAASEAEREDLARALVAEHVAAVLGHDSGAAIDPTVAFKDLGFDSLGAVELRNRLGAATGLRLPTTLVFDHPNVEAAATFILGLAAGETASAAPLRVAARSEEPIAIVGMSCRYPGGANSPAELWRLLESGGDAIARFPEDRGWDLERLYDPDPDSIGTTYSLEGGFVADVAEFDAAFFGIGPREAQGMDPQQRLLLEAAWEALEDAGVDPSSLAGSPTGVFAGVMHHDYPLVGGGGERYGYEGGTSGGSVVSGRVAYALGLEGPAITVDTACSSSLVAVHLAAASLRSGESELALAGGVSVSSTAGIYVMFSHQRGLAPDGRSKPFAAAADGAGFSEGVGALLLERLSDAERNGHEVLALVRGSATNQDGASNGISAPNGPSQERVIRQALANAGLAPADVDAVEAHGTGTTLGDPIEAQALLATYGQDRGEAGPLHLGAIKSNIGHAQAAAGVAGVIKMALAMRHGVLPKTLHLDAPTPHVDWDAGEIELLGEPVEWERNGHPRRAGISSFGISGTNAHVILEEPPAKEESDGAGEQDDSAPALPAIPLPLSAKGEEALRAQAKRLAEHLRENPEADLGDVAFSLATGRATQEHRATALGEDREELLEALGALANGKPHPGLVQGRAKAGKLAFLFSGQGAQRAGMGKELYESFPAFASALDEICAELDPLLDRSLKELLFADADSEEAALLDRTEFTQPALFALEVALYRQLQSWDLTPDYLLGHSIGELAAAHVAGVFDLADACKLIAARGALMGALPEGGAMVAIEASEAEIQEELPEGLSIAGINGPNAVVVSGEESAALKLAEAWKKGRKSTRLRVSHAFHSELMEPMLAEFEAVARTIDFQAPRLVVLSNLTGQPLTSEQATDPAYWAAQVRHAVRFADGVAYLAEQNATTLLELGPDGPLCAMAQGCFAAAGKEAVAVPTLRKDRGEAQALLGSLASVQADGAPFDWAQLFQGAKRVALPTYAFQRQRYWLEASAASGDASANGQSAADHPLLSAAISLPAEAGWLLTGRLSLKTHPWLGDHRVHGTAILPGTGFVELALKAAEQSGAEAIEELTIEAPLVLPEQGAVQVQVSVGPEDEQGSRPIAIHSRVEDAEDPEREWSANASGSLGTASTAEPQSLTEWPPAGAEPLAIDTLYERTAELGIDYGPAFQGVKAAWSRGEEIFAEVELDADQAAQAERFALHPALLDAALHPLAAAGEEGEGPEAPFAWNGVRLHRTGAASLRVSIAAPGTDAPALLVADASGAPLASVESLSTRAIPVEALAGAGQRDALFELDWVAQSLPTVEGASGEGIESEAGIELVALTADPGLDPASAAQTLTIEALRLLQAAIADEEEARLAFLTTKAMAVADGETPDPAAASVWGLVRAAQSEHPGRFLLIDSDGSEASAAALAAALAEDAEPQLALREGSAFVPRLVRAAAAAVDPAPLDPERTVLVTGATGTLGALFARHLVAEHGARQLLLTSRRGPDAPGAAELQQELQALGAEVRIEACDVGEREQLAQLLDAIPAEHPLGAVFHTAGALDDGVVESLDPERLATPFGPKASAAWHLHELTAEAELSDFVLFSSVAASFGNPGQGNYAAANSFLDALAQRRWAEGLPASAIAWGAWAEESAMTRELGGADRARFARTGIEALTSAEGLALFERSRAQAAPFLLAAGLDSAALRAQARAGTLPPLLSGLVRVPARRLAPTGALAARLAAAPEAEREGLVRALVAEHVAAVLGHASGAAIDPTVAFKDLGFDSLGAVELRNRLGAATGLRLPSTLVFDHPNVEAATAFLLGLAAGDAAGAAPARITARSEEPIAIVGIGCRYPGGVGSAAQLWDLVARGGDAITRFPEDRGWDLERLYDPDPDSVGTTYTLEGGFIDDAAGFDAAFFGISPREATILDPQQRQLLEAAWEALEDAGVDPSSLAGTLTGVFAGVMHHDYALTAGVAAVPSGFEGGTSGGSIVSGGVAYALGLEGPAITVDTACSSSLVAMHLAAASLRSGESELALAGGVSVSATAGTYVMFSHQRGLAPDGRSKPFAAAADGVAFSEGVGVLLLERLSDAERNGHEVLAVMRGSATNQDGASNGMTAPNGPSQERVIRQALANAGLEPSEVDVVEAHGTGTTLGDPIEAQALLATYGQDRGEAGPLHLGAIKSNLGHTQAAAGVAGVIKMALAMRHGVLPKTLHLDEPTPHVDWDAGEIELLGEPVEWERNGHPRRAGISSFGISGTNAHVILEEPPAPDPNPEDEPAERASLPAILLPLSAKGEEALRAQGKRLSEHLQANPDLDLQDVGFSLAASRATLENRATAIGSDREELLEILGALATGKPHPGLIQGRAKAGKLAFLFSGQGAQRAGMGKELYESFPAFAGALDEICAELDPHLGRSLKELLFADQGSEDAALLDRTEFTQPALFSLEVALYRQLQSWGLTPDYLLGHSIGELAAAHVAGVFDLPDACKLIAARGALMGALPEGGAMVAIEASEAEIQEGLPEGLSIAGINGPNSVVVSGEVSAALKLAETWKDKGRKTTRLRVSHAFHSRLMEPMLDAFEAVASEIDLKPPKLAVLSNLTGQPLTSEQATDPAYWAAQVRHAVRFADGVAHLAEQGTTTLLELGPDGPLCAMAQGCFAAAETEAVTVPTLRKDRAEATALLGSLAAAQANGAPFEWAQLFQGAKRVPLPTYAFQRQRYWLEASSGEGDVSAAGLASPDHPLLAAATSIPGEDGEGWLLTGRLSLKTHPWLGDHRVHGTAILPGTGFVELALKAAEQSGAEAIEELTIEAPLVLPEQGAVQVQVSVGAADEQGTRSLAIHSRVEGEGSEWIASASGALTDAVLAEPESLVEWPPQGAEPLAIDSLYERTAELGIDYGPAFQGVKAAWSRGEELFAEVELDADQTAQAERFALHPALLDAALHAAAAVAESGPDRAPKVPYAWRGLRLHRAGASGLRVALRPEEEVSALLIADPSGAPVLGIDSLATRAIPVEALAGAGADPHRDSLFELAWNELELSDAEPLAAEVCTPIRLQSSAATDLDTAVAAQALAAEALEALQSALAAAAETRHAFITRGAMAVAAEELPDPAAAAVWGLVRSAQAEHPGRFLLIDTDGSEASEAALAAALAQDSEPQLALRGGAAFVPRLARVDKAAAAEPQALDPEKTVFLSGATGTLGALFARHLVAAHGARQLLLTSRRGPDAPGAAELQQELEALGATVRIEACDGGEREQLAALLDSIPAAHPLGAVFHAAGVLADATVESLDRERLAIPFGPKASAAWNLHELTAEAELSDFVLFSSIASFGNPGQGNYAAANSFLDALAQRRRAEGLPASSIAWGAWGEASEMTRELSQADQARFARVGIRPLANADGLALFDRTRALPAPFLLAASLDVAALGAQARAGTLAPLYSGLVRVPLRRAAGGAEALAARLARAPQEEREGIVLGLVAEHVAAVLGHASDAAVDPVAPFKDLGFDSLGAVELRNRLGAATGLTLPSTLVFDYPTTAAVAAHVCALADPGAVAGAGVDAAIDRLGEMLDRLAREEREGANTRIRSLLSRGYAADADADAVERIRSASAAEILEIVNDEIGAK